MLNEQQLAEIAAHMDMRLTQIEVRLAAKHPKAAKDGELVAMLNDLDDHITALRESVLHRWEPKNNGSGAHPWFLMRDESVPIRERYRWNARGDQIRYASCENAQRAADKLNAQEARAS